MQGEWDNTRESEASRPSLINSPKENDFIPDELDTASNQIQHENQEEESSQDEERMSEDDPEEKQKKGEENDDEELNEIAATSTEAACNDAEEGEGTIVSPFFDDIISGRGKGPNAHFGNTNYRRMIKTNCTKYDELQDLKDKTDFVRNLVDEVKTRGRFLKKIGKDAYKEMDDDEAHRKVGQSLRYQLSLIQKRKGVKKADRRKTPK